jgi:hypothetical protein
MVTAIKLDEMFTPAALIKRIFLSLHTPKTTL